MKIIEHTAPVLPTVTMICDQIIDKKLTEHKAIEVCFSTSSTTIISGATGSGKTMWIIQMMRSVFRKCWHDIILMIPEASFRSISDKHNPFLKIDRENIYHTMDSDTLSEVYTKIEDNAAEGYFTLLIVDDFGADLKMKANEQILNRMFLKQRHLRLSTFILTQNYYMTPKKMREIVTNLVMFNTNKSQNFKVFRELFDLKLDQFDALMKMIPTAHDYCLLNLKYKRIFVDWNELVFSDE
jgi:predicted ATP-binding protein involved in virulence